MIIKSDQFLLLFRYNNIHVKDTIEQHIEVLKRDGYVWFGKIGLVPSIKTLQNIAKDGNFYIILHSSKGKPYICCSDGYSQTKPDKVYPLYYDQLFQEQQGSFSKMYFRIIEIQCLDNEFVNDFVLESSNDKISFALDHSMNSIFIIRSIYDKFY